MRQFLGWKNVHQGLVSAGGVEAPLAETCRDFIGWRAALPGARAPARVSTNTIPIMRIELPPLPGQPGQIRIVHTDMWSTSQTCVRHGIKLPGAAVA